MVHQLPEGMGTQVTALNFGATPIDEEVALVTATDHLSPGPVINMLSGDSEGQLTADGRLAIKLAGYEGKSLHIPRTML